MILEWRRSVYPDIAADANKKKYNMAAADKEPEVFGNKEICIRNAITAC